MKIILVLILSLIFPSGLYSQTDSSAESFFPSQVGDVWRYQEGPDSNDFEQTKLTRDSIASGCRYLFFDTSNVPLYKIDSVLNVTISPLQAPYAWLRYKLTAKKNEVWTVQGGPGGRIAGRVDDVYWDFVVGRETQVKEIGYYSQGSDTTNFSLWLYEDYLAAGFGYCLSIGDAEQTPNLELIGCIINGISYGSVTVVNQLSEKAVPSAYVLYPAFPDPFNPATTFLYSLPIDSRINITIYDVIGRQITRLVDGFQHRGEYSVRFEPRGLSSGVYFVRMVAGQFVQTNKIVYAK